MAAMEECNPHPLELIPYFRRFPGGPVRDLAYTVIFDCLVGTAFCLAAAALSGRLPTLAGYGVYLAVGNFIGFSVHGLFLLGRLTGIQARAIRRGFAAKVVYFSAIPTCGVIAGFQIAIWVFGWGARQWVMEPGWIVSIATTSVVISILLSAIFFWREREARAQAELEHERLRSERVEREAALANLRALQAQIEPHFLFNTLANVASLVDADPAQAKRMLETFIRFLRASLAATRTDTTTLGAEGELIASYLDVLRVRMGGRLAYTIDIPTDLAAFSIPPMLLQPVVENAIRHGLEPKVEGGAVAFGARRDGADVVIEVADSGVGFAPTTRGGVGLTNLRDRLRGLYGERAALAVADRAPGGALVTIRIPA